MREKQLGLRPRSENRAARTQCAQGFTVLTMKGNNVTFGEAIKRLAAVRSLVGWSAVVVGLSLMLAARLGAPGSAAALITGASAAIPLLLITLILQGRALARIKSEKRVFALIVILLVTTLIFASFSAWLSFGAANRADQVALIQRIDQLVASGQIRSIEVCRSAWAELEAVVDDAGSEAKLEGGLREAAIKLATVGAALAPQAERPLWQARIAAVSTLGLGPDPSIEEKVARVVEATHDIDRELERAGMTEVSCGTFIPHLFRPDAVIPLDLQPAIVPAQVARSEVREVNDLGYISGVRAYSAAIPFGQLSRLALRPPTSNFSAGVEQMHIASIRVARGNAWIYSFGEIGARRLTDDDTFHNLRGDHPIADIEGRGQEAILGVVLGSPVLEATIDWCYLGSGDANGCQRGQTAYVSRLTLNADCSDPTTA